MPENASALPPVRIVDLTAKQTSPPAKARMGTAIDGKIVNRRPTTIDSIVIHQTACVFGPLDDPEARYRRALGIPAHCVAFAGGAAVFANPLSWWLWHANGLNRRSLGLEIEGVYPGCPDDPTTPRREDVDSAWVGSHDVTPLTAQTVETARVALAELLRRATDWGAQIRYVFAHRQASDSRRSDPGWEIWQRVVLDYAVPVLGLKTLPEFTTGQGKGIPVEWDPKKGRGAY